MIKLLVDQLNEFPALRLAVLIIVFVVMGCTGTWVVASKLNDIDTSLTLLESGQGLAAEERKENKQAIKLNTEFRLRTEGAASHR